MAEGESLRFPALQKSVNQFIEEQKYKQTLSKTRRDVGFLSEFLKSKQENRKIEEVQPQELNDFLSAFIVNVKRKDGGDYEPSNLRGFIASFNRHLKNVKYSKSIVEDREFEQTRKALDACSKLLKKEGRGNRPFAAEAISDEHRQLCWSDVKLLRDADGTEYLEYCERQTKTRSGEEPWNIRPLQPKAFARPDGPPEKDPVFVYKF